MAEKYRVNEIFYSPQGEGRRAGTMNVFVRFSGCNLECSADGEAGFDCDTEFTSGVWLTLGALLETMNEEREKAGAKRGHKACILTGGEPCLQADRELIAALHRDEWFVAIETNGTVEPAWKGGGIDQEEIPDWVSCSPKTAEHTLRLGLFVDEVRYVRNPLQGIPKPGLQADHYFLSPAASAEGVIDRDSLRHCLKLCAENPRWALSVQQHKLWGVR